VDPAIQELEGKIASLEQTIPTLRKGGIDVGQLEQDLSNLKQQRVAARGPQAEVSSLGAKLDHAKAKRVQLQNELTEKQNDVAEAEKLVEEAKKAVADQEAAIAQATANITELEASLNQAMLRAMPLGQPGPPPEAQRDAERFLAMAPEAKNLGPDVLAMVAKLLTKHLMWTASQGKPPDGQKGDGGENSPTPMDESLGDADFEEICKACKSEGSKRALEDLCQRMGMRKRQRL
jgi:hypothetical protein